MCCETGVRCSLVSRFRADLDLSASTSSIWKQPTPVLKPSLYVSHRQGLDDEDYEEDEDGATATTSTTRTEKAGGVTEVGPSRDLRGVGGFARGMGS